MRDLGVQPSFIVHVQLAVRENFLLVTFPSARFKYSLYFSCPTPTWLYILHHQPNSHFKNWMYTKTYLRWGPVFSNTIRSPRRADCTYIPRELLNGLQKFTFFMLRCLRQLLGNIGNEPIHCAANSNLIQRSLGLHVSVHIEFKGNKVSYPIIRN